jgi:hypothetical protein
MENNQQESFLQMQLDYDGGNILQQTVRWSRFLSIAGIIALALCALAFAFAGSLLLSTFSRLAPGFESLAGLGSALIIAVILVILAVFGYVVFMLYRFSVLTRRGIERQDQVVFAEGMKCLKVYFIISGILALLGLLGNLLSLTKLFHS